MSRASLKRRIVSTCLVCRGSPRHSRPIFRYKETGPELFAENARQLEIPSPFDPRADLTDEQRAKYSMQIMESLYFEEIELARMQTGKESSKN